MSDAMENRRWLTADQAAELLKVKKETIYAYVSRGRLTNRRATDGRGSLFDAAEIERLAVGAQQGGRPGSQEVESALTLLTDQGHFYRGRNAQELAATRSYEDVAQFLWGVDSDGLRWSPADDIAAITGKVLAALPSTVLPIDQIKMAASCIEVLELPEWDTSVPVVAASARRAFATLVSALPQRSEAVPKMTGSGAYSPLGSVLWSRLCERKARPEELSLLNAAMVVLADHDLASATVLARSAARAGISVGGLIRLGADVGSGPVKGAASLAIETFLHNLQSPESVDTALTLRLRQGEPIPGFGHAMYPAGDPRASYLLDRLGEIGSGSKRYQAVEQLIRIQRERGVPKPNAGFALAAFTYVSGMVPGAGEVIFVVSRAAGWVAHAIEESAFPPAPRQRSRYRGPSIAG